MSKRNLTSSGVLVLRQPLERIVLLQQLDETLSISWAQNKVREETGYFGYIKDVFITLPLDLLESYIYARITNYMESNIPSKGQSTITKLLRSVLCYSATTVVTYPLQTIRNKHLADINCHKYDSIVDCAKQTVESRGIPGFYRGYGLSVASFAMNHYISGSIYNSLMSKVEKSQHEKSWGSLISGFSKGIARMISYPLSTYIKRSQVLDVECPSLYGLYNGVVIAFVSQFLGDVVKSALIWDMK